MTKQKFLDNIAEFVRFMGLTPSFTEVEVEGIKWTEVWLSGVKTDVAFMLEEMEKDLELFDERGLHKATILYTLGIKNIELEALRIADEMVRKASEELTIDGKKVKDLTNDELRAAVHEVMGRVRNTNPLDELIIRPGKELN